jgi:DNA modification methylase
MTYAIARRRGDNGELNKLYPEDRAVHEWYRFVLSFPPHLVRDYLQRFSVDGRHQVLDPFCGTGTVVVECKKLGIPSVGVEANPMAHFAGQVKTDWAPDPAGLVEHATHVATAARTRLARDGIDDDPVFLLPPREDTVLRDLPSEAAALLLAESISPLPLHKTLVLLDCLRQHRDERYDWHQRLALAKALVANIGNLHFGPEVGVGPAKPDAPVVAPWLANVRATARGLVDVQAGAAVPAVVHHADARHLGKVVAPCSIDAVITSPPYPNEKDYTRTTRLESVLLGFIRDKADLQALKRGLVRSNTRGVYKGDDDDRWVAEHPEIQRIAAAIEARRVELGKTSGFERLYARVTRLYFGGMARHLAELRPLLRPGAQLAYVVGDQASYLRVMIRTGQLLADIAQSLGYEVVDIDLFRTRLATATKEQLREEVVILRWSGVGGAEAVRSPQQGAVPVALTTCSRFRPRAGATDWESCRSSKISPCARPNFRGSSSGLSPHSSWPATSSHCSNSRRPRTGSPSHRRSITGLCHQTK